MTTEEITSTTGTTTEDKNLNQLMADLKFSDLQKRLVVSSKVALPHQINRSRIIAEIYFTNRIEEFTNHIIESNAKLAASNDRFSKAANWLTAGLVILALLQLVIEVIRLITR
jgi:hypothetical protein